MTIKIPTLFLTSVFFLAQTSLADITVAAPDEVGDCTVSQYANCDNSPDPDQLDASGTTGAQDGNWDDLTGGTANRPYISRLSVINDDTETVLISNGSVTTPLSATPGSVGATIVPINLCDSTETPGTSCYASPNRIQVNLVYRKQSGEVGYNFSFPNDGNSGGTTGNELSLLSTDGTTPITINEDTTIDLTIALNTLGSSLRWSWLNGIPSAWKITNGGTTNASVRVKFKLAMMPAIAYSLLDGGASFCSAIPVSTCNIEKSHSDWLGGALLLSLDNTLSAGMTGALFATEGAIIGSVDASTDSSTGLPRLTYGLSSSHFDSSGEARSATLRAFIPDNALVQVLGIPSFADRNAAPTNATDVIGVEKVGTSRAVSRTFTEWSASANGTNGLLMRVNNISFSVPKYRLKAKNGSPRVPSVSLALGFYRFTLSASSGSIATTCKAQACKVEVYRAAASKVSAALTKIATKTATRTKQGFTAPITLLKNKNVKKNTRLLVVLKNKAGKVLSSTPIVLKK